MTLSADAAKWYIKEVLGSGRKITAWEQGFIATIQIQASQSSSLTEKQAEKLLGIYERVTDAKITYKAR